MYEIRIIRNGQEFYFSGVNVLPNGNQVTLEFGGNEGVNLFHDLNPENTIVINL